MYSFALLFFVVYFFAKLVFSWYQRKKNSWSTFTRWVYFLHCFVCIIYFWAVTFLNERLWSCRSPLNPVPTTKSRMETGPPPLISIVPKSEETGYLHPHVPRPSVITSTNIIRRPVGFMAPAHLYGPADMFCYPGPHRREVVESGVIDPFVEEHFRRSLGEDYKCVSPTSMSAAGSVDDHFAKALGDTWQKLKKSEVSSQPSSTSQMQSIVSPANWRDNTTAHKIAWEKYLNWDKMKNLSLIAVKCEAVSLKIQNLVRLSVHWDTQKYTVTVGFSLCAAVCSPL